MIILIIILLIVQKYLFYSCLINGLWIGTDEFNEQSELTNMIVLIEGNCIKKRMFISMFSNGENIFSNIYDLYISPTIDIRSCKSKTICYTNCDIMKKIMMLEISTEGILTLQWGKTVYFEGIKM